MKSCLTYLLLPAVLMTICCRSEAAMPEKASPTDFHTHFDLAFLLGARMHNDNFLYDPGFALLGTYGKQLYQKAFFGLGTGVVVLQDFVFAPVFMDFTGNRGGRTASSLVNLQLGYAPGFDRIPSAFSKCCMGGGIFMGVGIGQQFRLRDELSFALILAYRHQFASIEYQVANEQTYSEKLNYDMLSLGIRIIL